MFKYSLIWIILLSGVKSVEFYESQNIISVANPLQFVKFNKLLEQKKAGKTDVSTKKNEKDNYGLRNKAINF